MLITGGGTFVSVSSTSAAIACPGIPAWRQGSTQALSRQVCADYGRQGIRSNVVRLGSMLVPGNARYADAAFAAASRAQVMVPRLATPGDLAEAVAFSRRRPVGSPAGVVSVDAAPPCSMEPRVWLAWALHSPGSPAL
jgi:NAD(P)-dependent dehydrogenase (short-subunit alcohol dehydrogenase family)